MIFLLLLLHLLAGMLRWSLPCDGKPFLSWNSHSHPPWVMQTSEEWKELSRRQRILLRCFVKLTRGKSRRARQKSALASRPAVNVELQASLSVDNRKVITKSIRQPKWRISRDKTIREFAESISIRKAVRSGKLPSSGARARCESLNCCRPSLV